MCSGRLREQTGGHWRRVGRSEAHSELSYIMTAHGHFAQALEHMSDSTACAEDATAADVVAVHQLDRGRMGCRTLSR